MKQRTQDNIKNKSHQDMVIFLEAWKRKKRRIQVYRICLGATLCFCCLVLLGIGYLILDEKIPSVIRLKAGTEQELDLRVPMTADVSEVSGQAEASVPGKTILSEQERIQEQVQTEEMMPKPAITLNLSKSVTLRADELKNYQMNVKLFGVIPFKQVDIQVIEEQELIPMGIPVGIYMETDGVLVAGTASFQGQDGMEYAPSKNRIKAGDYLRKLNGEDITDKDSFIRQVESCNGQEITLTVERDSRTMDVTIQPAQNQNGAYKIGAWIKDNAQGVGTMTYMDGDGHFGALGHGVNDIDTSTLMELDAGSLYRTDIVSIKKGEDGSPGEMTGMIVYSGDNILGEITVNGEQGIFGTCNEKAFSQVTNEALPIGLKQEIVAGPAQICCTISEEPEYFDVEILEVHLDHDNVNRGIELKVTDQRLLEVTGGIVQGMSGSPVIQNGKLVGAVTHVLVNDPTRGYGIFIENMLEAAK